MATKKEVYKQSIKQKGYWDYNELYGSIGALIIMMLYIWINSISLLLGFELNVVIYKLKNN